MSIATGIGSLPGEDVAEAITVVLGELGDHLAYLPELPARGALATMTGRALAILEGLDADLQPAGWRLTGGSGSPGLDRRRARSLLAQDLDMLEERAQDHAGAFKVQVAGPWTLAATVERPRGDKILADHGARRDLAQALAEGVRTHLRDVRRRLPRLGRLVVQVDEPGLAAVLTGGVPTASGYGRHRCVERPEASDTLSWLFEAITEEGAEPWVHSCAPGTPLDLLRGAGARGLAVDVGVLSASDTDHLAAVLEDGGEVALGVIPAVAPEAPLSDKQVTERVLRWLDMVGLAPEELGDRLVLAPTCGQAGASPDWVRQTLRLARTAASSLSGRSGASAG